VAEIYRAVTGTPYTNNPEANWFLQKLYQLIYDMSRTAGSYQEALEGVIQEAWVNRSSAFQLLRALCGALSQNRETDAMLLGEAPKADTLLSVFLYDLVLEELGLVGGTLIMVLFALLIIRGFWLAIHARDRFGSLLIVGVTTQIALQTFLNIAVVTNLIPSTGISLPFFSSGGTALVIQLVEVGVVLSVSRQIPAPKAW